MPVVVGDLVKQRMLRSGLVPTIDEDHEERKSGCNSLAFYLTDQFSHSVATSSLPFSFDPFTSLQSRPLLYHGLKHRTRQKQFRLGFQIRPLVFRYRASLPLVYVRYDIS
jgi:hypothetical protein